MTLVRNLEFQLEKIPASDYSVSFPFLQRGIASYFAPTEPVRVSARTLHCQVPSSVCFKVTVGWGFVRDTTLDITYHHDNLRVFL